MKMKNILRKLPTFIGVCILMILTSCTTSKSVVSQGVNLSKYKYVAVIDDDTYRMPPPNLYNIRYNYTMLSNSRG